MTPEFWLERWATGQIGFHQPAPNPYLVRWWPELGVKPGGRVLVPLCGKSHDLTWLAAGGWDVVGVELAEAAATAFFAERGLQPVLAQRGAHVARSVGGLTILQGDFFAPVAGAPFAAAYDRAALIALPPDMRPRYVTQLRALLGPDAPLLLVTLDYPLAERNGPPFAVSPDEVKALYDDAYSLDLVQTVNLKETEPERMGALTWAHERVWVLTPR